MSETPSFYTQFYCEENIYNLLLALQAEDSGRGSPFDRRYAVLFSTFRTAISQEVANQWTSRAPYRPFRAKGADDLVLWDYHVIAVVRAKESQKWFVIDFDSNLSHLVPAREDLDRWTPFCVELPLYAQKTFFLDDDDQFRHHDRLSHLCDQVRFRIMGWDEYVSALRTDRSHMVGDQGVYSAPPPPRPPIAIAPQHINGDLLAKYATIEATLDESRKKNNLVCFINMNNVLFPGRIVDRYQFLDAFRC